MTKIQFTPLTLWCWSVIAFGAVFAASAIPALDMPTRLFYDLVSWPLDGVGGWAEPVRFTAALLGAVTMGWGLTALALVDVAARHQDLAARQALTRSILIWYLIDSGISVILGVPGNAVSNTAIVGAYLLAARAT